MIMYGKLERTGKEDAVGCEGTSQPQTGGSEKIHGNLSKESLRLRSDLNRVPPEYK
jgi:hypothetical protein